MKAAPISLVDYFATDLSLATNRNFAADKAVQFVDSEFLVDVALKPISPTTPTDRVWQVTLEVRHTPGPETNFAYSYRVVLVGQFSVAPRVEKTEEERTVRIHGASVLYGMAREIVRALTGRGPFRPVILPTVSFYEQRVAVSAVTESPGLPPSLPDSAPKPAKKRRAAKET